MAWTVPVLAALAGCQEKPPADPQISVDLSQQEGFPKTVQITIHSNSDEPLCIPGDQINNGYENLAIAQNGKPVRSDVSSNRAMKPYKGINALDPIYVILKGDTDFWYELDDFPLAKGRFDVGANIKLVRCADLFGRIAPRWFAAAKRKTFNYDPDMV